MMFYFTKLESITPSGLPARIASSSYLKSSYFKNRPCNWYYTYTSPDEVILCPDNKQSLYCHLLCGLVQRNEVTRMGSIFASVMVRAINLLKIHGRSCVQTSDQVSSASGSQIPVVVTPCLLFLVGLTLKWLTRFKKYATKSVGKV